MTDPSQADEARRQSTELIRSAVDFRDFLTEAPDLSAAHVERAAVPARLVEFGDGDCSPPE